MMMCGIYEKTKEIQRYKSYGDIIIENQSKISIFCLSAAEKTT